MSQDYTPQIMLSLFSQIMICLFEPEHFFGIPPEAPGTAAKELAARMRAADTPNTKAWLGLTRKMLLEIDLKADMDADEMLAEMAVKHTVEMLSAAIAINWAAEKPTMHKIFPSVIGLYRNLHCCKAIFKLRMISCHSSQRPSIFAMTTIEAVTSDENEDSLTSRPIELSVFPGICKYGNEMCRNHHMTVICRARAILQKIKRKQAQLGEDVPTKNTRIKQEPV
ncbi:hypothetical protein D0864_09257 [Hortaea werneckii]|uniref:Uncharacterized protein n=1 Tax=Hortaea werneckii TaxID=91943 RepID=A0A3M7EPT9_HORWE|nr:hypothetical protein D0864_09257 [Hortaea werneckii]